MLDFKFLGKPRQVAGTALLHNGNIFQPHGTDPTVIQTWFDRYHVTRFQYI